MKLAEAVGVEVRGNGTVKYNEQSMEDVSVRGVTANIGQMDVEEPATGRYITDTDNDHRTNVTMIGSDVAKRFFPSTDPLGKEVRIDGIPYIVVGVAKPLGTALGQTQDNFAYMPIQTFFKVYGNQQSLSVNVQAKSAGLMEQTQDEARAIMRARRHLTPKQDDTFGILASSSLMDLWNNLTGTLATSMVGIVLVF